MRNLTLQGRIRIIKSFIISKFQYQLSNDSCPLRFIKILNKIIFKYIWNSKTERINRKVLVQNYENGGLEAPHLEAKILTSRIAWMKRYLYTEHIPWKQLWEWQLNLNKEKTVISLLANNNAFKNKDLSKFYQEILLSCNLLKKEYYKREKLRYQLLWLNENFKIGNKLIFWQNIVKESSQPTVCLMNSQT